MVRDVDVYFACEAPEGPPHAAVETIPIANRCLRRVVYGLHVTAFLAVAAMRIIQPRQYDSTHTSGIIFEWTATHISRFGAAMLFLATPGLGVIASSVTQRRIWGHDKALRHSRFHGLTIFRRDLVIALLTTATLLGAAILTSAVAHLATD